MKNVDKERKCIIITMIQGRKKKNHSIKYMLRDEEIMCTPIRIKEVSIGEGKPKICIPLTGENLSEISREAKKIASIPCDMIEWRADLFSEFMNKEATDAIIEKIHSFCPQKPLVLTLRTKYEGGNADVTKEEAIEWILSHVANPFVDIIDVEYFTCESKLKKVMDSIHVNHKVAILSYHNFQGTPEMAEMLSIMMKMDQSGGDILKMAVMPKERKDVMSVLNMTMEMATKTTKPLVTMSMGKAGVLSRFLGEMTGSAITFAVGEKASAPGQISAGALEQILELLHESV